MPAVQPVASVVVSAVVCACVCARGAQERVFVRESSVCVRECVSTHTLHALQRPLHISPTPITHMHKHTHTSTHKPCLEGWSKRKSACKKAHVIWIVVLNKAHSHIIPATSQMLRLNLIIRARFVCVLLCCLPVAGVIHETSKDTTHVVSLEVHIHGIVYAVSLALEAHTHILCMARDSGR
jgi:hypothetical protein